MDARLVGGAWGGVESAIIGLADGLSRLDDGNEEYSFLVWPDHADWIAPYLSGRCRPLFARTPNLSSLKTWLAQHVRITKSVWDAVTPHVTERVYRVGRSDGTVEQAGIDLMHLMIQAGFRTDIPAIYHPHDLQHRHFPDYFTRSELLRREIVYKTLCDQATMVAVTSSWVKHDVVRAFGLTESKVQVVPFAPVLPAYPDPTADDLDRARAAYGLPERFVFYPAQTWPHKNHIGLLNALAHLRDTKSVRVELVCSGALNDFFAEIRTQIRRLRLEDQVRFVGFVTPLDLSVLHRLATALVVPSRFEAASFPLWDAFISGTPAACSNVTSLPDQAGDAALLFDPDNAGELAAALERLWVDEELRHKLAARGRVAVAKFTWDRTARHFRAHYRRITRRPMSDDDRYLIAQSPLL